MEGTLNPHLVIGIDWATQAHAVCILNGEHPPTHRTIENTPAALADFGTWLRESTAPPSVAIERPDGPLVETMMESGASVYYVHPRQFAALRASYSVALAKDDPRDAWLLADALRECLRRGATHLFRPIIPPPDTVLLIRDLSRRDAAVMGMMTAQTNVLRDQVCRTAPYLAGLPMSRPVTWALLNLALSKTGPVSLEVLTEHLRSVNARNITKRAPAWLELLNQPLLGSPGVVSSVRSQVRLLTDHCQLLHVQRAILLEEITKQLELARTQWPELAVMETMPGIGVVSLAALIGEAFGLLQRNDLATLRAVAGVAPVTRASGTSHVVVMRRQCNRRLRTAVHHMARTAVVCDPYYKAHYDRLRARGHAYMESLRMVADKQLRHLCTMIERRQPYRIAGVRIQPNTDPPVTATP